MTVREVTSSTRAYAAFEVKALNPAKRRFSGIATAPSVDRVGDIINPMGVSYTNPLVLLHQHRHDMPIGKAWFDKPTKKGIAFEAEIPSHDEPGPLKDRLDTAWGEISLGLVRAVSIGFQPTKYAYFENGGVDYQEISVYELSAVSIPALPDAVISAVKSMQALTPAMVRLLRNADSRGIPLITAKNLRSGSVPLIKASP